MPSSADQKLHDLLVDFNVAMLVTRTPDGHLRARPMALAEVEPNCCLWFVTDKSSGKLDELAQDEHALVTMQSSKKFVSLSGTASRVDDRERVARLWNSAWKAWFQGGKDDPNLVLLRFDGQKGEYWDNSGASGIKYLIEMGKALLTRETPEVEGDPKLHGKVSL